MFITSDVKGLRKKTVPNTEFLQTVEFRCVLLHPDKKLTKQVPWLLGVDPESI